jgi:hypothetical protein
VQQTLRSSHPTHRPILVAVVASLAACGQIDTDDVRPELAVGAHQQPLDDGQFLCSESVRGPTIAASVPSLDFQSSDSGSFPLRIANEGLDGEFRITVSAHGDAALQKVEHATIQLAAGQTVEIDVPLAVLRVPLESSRRSTHIGVTVRRYRGGELHEELLGPTLFAHRRTDGLLQVYDFDTREQHYSSGLLTDRERDNAALAREAQEPESTLSTTSSFSVETFRGSQSPDSNPLEE